MRIENKKAQLTDNWKSSKEDAISAITEYISSLHFVADEFVTEIAKEIDKERSSLYYSSKELTAIAEVFKEEESELETLLDRISEKINQALKLW